MAEGGVAEKRKKMFRQESDAVDPDRPYPMNLPRLGHAVIVNNIATEMPGSLHDVEALTKAYETVGFDVHIYNDCNDKQMRKVKKWIMNEDNHRDSNCFALTVISHGNEKGHLLDKNKILAWHTELFIAELSDVETLVGKPKVITIQACRGLQWSEGKPLATETLADDDDVESTHILPDKADMFLAYATVPGYRAHAGGENGSIYLQALARYLKQEYMKRPLDRILKMVRQHMVRKVQGTHGMRQCPEERNSLIYDVRFSEFYGKGSERKKVVSQADHEKEIERIKQEMQKAAEEQLEKERQAMQREMEKLRLANKDTQRNMSSHDQPRLQDVKFKAIGMQLLSTQDTALPFWNGVRISASPSGDNVILFSKMSKDDPPAFIFYNLETLKKYKVLTALCEHEQDVSLWPVTVEDQKLLSVSCSDCQTIRLFNVNGNKATLAFQDKMFYPGTLCQGNRNQIFCVHMVEGFPVLDIDASTPNFKVNKVLETGINGISDMIYVPRENIVVISDSEGGTILALSCSMGEVAWEVNSTDSSKFKPDGLAFSQKHNVIIVCAVDQILLLKPSDGSDVLTISVSPNMGTVFNVCVVDDRVVILHKFERKLKLSKYVIQ